MLTLSYLEPTPEIVFGVFPNSLNPSNSSIFVFLQSPFISCPCSLTSSPDLNPRQIAAGIIKKHASETQENPVCIVPMKLLALSSVLQETELNESGHRARGNANRAYSQIFFFKLVN